MKAKKSLFAAALMLIILLCGCSADGKRDCIPERISLYIEEENSIITMDYSEYLTGCIFAAADPSFQTETLLAAGIACSGRALYCMENSERADFLGADLSDNPELSPDWVSPEELIKEYGDDYEDYAVKITAIAKQAAMMYPEYEGKPANTILCKVSTGITDDGGLPYLPPLTLPCDKDSPYYSSSCILTDEIVRKNISSLAGSVILPPNRAEWFTDADYTEGGTLRAIRFGNNELTGEQLRQALGLRSTAIFIEQSGDIFTFTTRGAGSNTGMSLYAAERLARGGKSAIEILKFFYPGTEIYQAE